MMMLTGPRHCRAFTCALSGAPIGVFFMGQDIGGLVDSWPETLVPSASNRSTPEWTLVDSRSGRFDKKQVRLELAAAIGLVEALGVLFRKLWPSLAALAQLAVEVRLALGVERLAAFLAVDRGLDQQRVDQVLDVPCLVGRQVAETHHELLHHAHRDRRQG